MDKKNDPRLGLPSASSFDADVACPGRRNLIRSLPDLQDDDDDDAARGTRIHKAWQTNDVSVLEDDSELEDYTAGLKHIDDVINMWKLERRLVRIEELPREAELWIHDGQSMRPLFSGRIDRWYKGWDAAGNLFVLIIDGKSGWGTHVPPSQKAWQLRIYAVLAWRETDALRIRVAFVKPKQKSNPTDWTDYFESDLVQAAAAAMHASWKTEQPDAARSAGPHCRWCLAKPHCPEAAAMSLLPSIAVNLTKPIKRFKKEDEEAVVAAVASLTIEDSKKLWEMTGVITKVLEANKQRIKSLSEADRTAIGLTLGAGREMRSITNIGQAFAHLWKQCDFIPEELFPTMKFLNTALVQTVAFKKKMAPDEAAAWLWTQLEPWTKTTESEKPIRVAKDETK